MKKFWILLILAMVTVTLSYGQKFAAKSNLLYDATTTLIWVLNLAWGKK